MAATDPSVVIFDRAGHLASLQRSTLRANGILKHSTVETTEALIKDLILGRDAVLLNWFEADWAPLVAIVKLIRVKDTSPDPFVGLVVISPQLNATNAKLALDAGVNSLVKAPFSAGDIMKQVALITAKHWRFIDSPGYFGPDRRKRAGESPDGVERRGAQCKVLEGQELDAERARMRSTSIAAFEFMVSHNS